MQAISLSWTEHRKSGDKPQHVFLVNKEALKRWVKDLEKTGNVSDIRYDHSLL